MSETVIEQINRLKKEKNAVILAHYYVDGEVQAIADYVGDSYFLAKKATTVDADVIWQIKTLTVLWRIWWMN